MRNDSLEKPSSSVRLVLFMIPALILVTGFASIQSPSWVSSWDFWSSPFSSSSYTNISSSTSRTISDNNNATTASNSSTSSMPDWATAEDLQGVEDRLLELHAENNDKLEDKEPNRSNDVVSNRSSPPLLLLLPPPLATPAVQLQQAFVTEAAARTNMSRIGSLTRSSMNGTRSVLLTAGLQKRSSKLDKLEAGLRRARLTIRAGNRTGDRDYVPVGPMYWNADTFHRSYLEMEKQFKVYVYEEGEPPVFHNGPCKSIYSMEGTFIHEMEMNTQFRTRDPHKAHVFFLPFSVTMLVRFVYVRDSHDFKPIKHTIIDYLNTLARRHPFWDRSHGADHFMLSCHDWGPEASRSVPNLKKNAIRVLCNANTSEGFNPMKDVSFPEINLQTGATRGLLGGPSPSRRSILGFFAGGLHGPIRPLLLQHWENKDNDIQVHQYLPKGVSYYDMMRKSKYCICPSGYEVASPRIVEALYTGCVPVLISDHYVPPFSDILNWKAFSVEVPVGEIHNLKRILEGISTRRYIRMQARGKQVRRHFEVNSPPKRFDVFHLILHSIWLRRLNVRVHEMGE